MFLVTVKNAHTGESQQYMCKSLTIGENHLGFPKENCKQVCLHTGIFGRKDSGIIVETDEPVRIISEKYLDAITIGNAVHDGINEGIY